MEKKNLAIIILAVVLVLSGVGNVVLAVMAGWIEEEPDLEVLKVGTTENPVTIDPQDTWDSVSNNILDNIVEPLIKYDFTDPTIPLVPLLAESWSWPSTTQVTFILRKMVYFHDGALLTAECVTHTINRINYFGNWSGTLPSDQKMAFCQSIYKFGDGTPIFNGTIEHDDYNVSVILNRPFGPGEGLLAYTASSIVHPDSTPATTMLDLTTDKVIGTGPFKYVKYKASSEVRMKRWVRYWRTGTYFDEVVHVYYKDTTTVNNAMLALDIDYLGQGDQALKQTYIDDPDIHVQEVGVATLYFYIVFNSKLINLTWRKAIQCAFNYTYFIDEIQEGTVIRARSLVPPGFPAHNASVQAMDQDVIRAREYMQSMGYGFTDPVTPWDTTYPGGANEADWKNAIFNTAWNKMRVSPGSTFYEQYFKLLHDNLDLIGIEIVEQPLTWAEYIQLTEAAGGLDQLHIMPIGWGPDYFETFNMIDPLLNPISSANWGQNNITEINVELLAAETETDTVKRYAIYEKLQSLIHDKYYCHMPLWYNKLYVVHAANLKGFPYNINRDLYWWPCYRE